MYLNTLSPAAGKNHAKKRVGRGPGSDLGKTAGRGHKGQKSRSGGYHKVGFEGGQQPLQRRLPKFGFNSRKETTFEVRTAELNAFEGEVSLQALKDSRILPKSAKFAKVILSGDMTKAVKVVGLKVTKGAQAAIENAGGSVG